MRNFLLPFFALASLAACQTISGSSFDTAQIDQILSDAVESGEVIGVSALVYDEGQVVYQNAFGLQDRERSKPVKRDTIFRIYSMTKPITSALIMDLAEDGELSLNNPAEKYIPELAQMKVAIVDETGTVEMIDQTNPMTIKDLLLHRAGLGYGIFGATSPVEAQYEAAGLFDPDEDLSVKMEKLSTLPLVAQPGEGWYYSYSIDVLGRIAEVVTGEDFDELMQERLLDPLGMTETGFVVRPDQQDRFASNYILLESGEYELQDDSQSSDYLKDLPFKSGGGGLVSTLDDYSRFAQMMLQRGQLNGVRVLNAETVDAMMKDQMDADDSYFFDWVGPKSNAGFGYGGSVKLSHIEQQLADDGQGKGQWGWSGLANTQFFVDPENNAYAIIMLQYFAQEDATVRDRFRAAVTQQVKN